MIGYLDMPSGISGDMFLGCLVDAGYPLVELEAMLAGLDVPRDSWSLSLQETRKGALRAALLNVTAAEGDSHRHLSDILGILARSRLPEPVKARAGAVFQRLAGAEAAVHGSTVEEVHFHEVGAVDAIVDIVGVCAGLHALGITQLYAGALPLGEGWTNSAHGRIPLPAPATLALLAAVGAPTRPAPGPGELVTPTGAALVAEFAVFRQPPMRLVRMGLGAGRKDFAWPNVARLWLGETEGAGDLETAEYTVLETNIDDMSPELYSATSTALFRAGALDVWLTPILMKKGRPAQMLGVLAPPADEARLVDLVLRETTSLGVRARTVRRYAAQRTVQEVTTRYGAVRVKVKWVGGKAIGAKPEYEDCVRLAEQCGVAVRQIHEAATAAAQIQCIEARPQPDLS
jgi:pyridinium-3,5-bisthiocarboxylic acid mononucleotide nickel chelatase